MKKISIAVMDLITRQPFLEEAMSYGFLNLTSFAEYIQNHIGKEVGKPVSIHAIKMALSRMKNPKLTPSLQPISHSFAKVTTRRGLSIMTLVRSAKSIDIVTNYMMEKRRKESQFFTMVEWVNEIDIIFQTSDAPSLYERFPQSMQILTVNDLGLISCELSDAEISTPWLFYRVTKRLAFHGVNIIQVLSTYHELGVIVSEKDIKQAVNLLLD